MVKRKSSSLAQATDPSPGLMHMPSFDHLLPAPAKRRASQRKQTRPLPKAASTNPDINSEVLDGPEALRASPDAEEKDEKLDVDKIEGGTATHIQDEEDTVPSLVTGGESDSSLSDVSDVEPPSNKKPQTAKSTKTLKTLSKTAKALESPSAGQEKNAATKEPQFLDPEADGEEEADEEEIQAALSRPPPVNSDYLPLPWKGRLGYACLCTYLRYSNPPVFSSRTCRIASILENRHPLRNPDEPPHATKNRPDRDQPADISRGQAFVESLGIANAKDIVKMLRWNDRYGIKFLRLSSEMFPFASHEEYGYKLAPFASEALAEAGKVAGELGHRLTTHPGQFTQLGSPRKSVIDNALRDLEYHAELLSLLKLPPQQDRDAVMILHLGGVFGDKEATLERFRENYKRLSPEIKKRLVLENDDVSWSVHDLLPLCEELNIPMVLDFHHNNIIFDSEHIREGTKDIMDLYPRILATWKRKNITPKMHYSEPTPAAITGRQRRKHNPRVATLPPCPPDMDLMIEAKDKEQAVFELMRTFKLPGFDTFNDMLPHVRKDDNKPVKFPKKKTLKKKRAKEEGDDTLEAAEAALDAEDEEFTQAVIPEEEVGMGGPEGRVYWPPGMEDWLRPVKKVVKKKEPADRGKPLTTAQKRKAAAEAAQSAVKLEANVNGDGEIDGAAVAMPTPAKRSKATPKSSAKKAAAPKKNARSVQTPSTSDDEASVDAPPSEAESVLVGKKSRAAPTRQSARAKKISYVEEDGE
ncbi:UV-damage endonuclease [Xylographa opegraphella]|nr:UV-damage endonuclease [Xylographa opegraphella]